MLEEVRVCISSITMSHQRVKDADGNEVLQSIVSKVTFWNKNQALESLAKWRGMFIDRIEQGKPGDFDHLTDDELRESMRQELARLLTTKAIHNAATVPKIAPADESASASISRRCSIYGELRAEQFESCGPLSEAMTTYRAPG